MNTTSVTTVVFHGQEITTLEHHSETYVAMKPICEAIGLGWQSQFNRIKRHPLMVGLRKRSASPSNTSTAGYSASTPTASNPKSVKTC